MTACTEAKRWTLLATRDRWDGDRPLRLQSTLEVMTTQAPWVHHQLLGMLV